MRFDNMKITSFCDNGSGKTDNISLSNDGVRLVLTLPKSDEFRQKLCFGANVSVCICLLEQNNMALDKNTIYTQAYPILSWDMDKFDVTNITLDKGEVSLSIPNSLINKSFQRLTIGSTMSISLLVDDRN